MNKFCGTRIDSIFLTRRDGLEPEEVYSQLAWPKKLRPSFLTLATIPAWLGAKSQSDDVTGARRRVASEDKARFIVGSLLSRTGRLLGRLEPQVQSTSKWSAYQECNSYPAEGLRYKQDFVEEALREFRPKRLLDVGRTADCTAKSPPGWVVPLWQLTRTRSSAANCGVAHGLKA